MRHGIFWRLIGLTMLALILAGPFVEPASRVQAASFTDFKPHTGLVSLDFHLLEDGEKRSIPALEVTTAYAFTPEFALSVSSMGVYYPGENGRGIDRLGVLWQFSPGLTGSVGWQSQPSSGESGSPAGGPEVGLNLSTPLGPNTTGFAQGYLASLAGRLPGGYMLGVSTQILPEWSFNLSYRSNVLDNAKSGFGLGFAYTYP
ncbi:MAG: hypothetical protein ACM3TT_02610, partial [Syntrophothermus sp.]